MKRMRTEPSFYYHQILEQRRRRLALLHNRTLASEEDIADYKRRGLVLRQVIKKWEAWMSASLKQHWPLFRFQLELGGKLPSIIKTHHPPSPFMLYMRLRVRSPRTSRWYSIGWADEFCQRITYVRIEASEDVGFEGQFPYEEHSLRRSLENEQNLLDIFQFFLNNHWLKLTSQE